MAVREYIGARYVPKFMGLWSNTTQYEALSIVDDGLGTSYTSKIPVPAGTPLTDTDYWAVTGSLNGAITHLQDQIDDINTELGDYITPDDFTGTDGQKLQAAFDAVATDGGTIVINRAYTLDQNITISHPTNNPNHHRVNVIGLGKEAKIDFDIYSFEGAGAGIPYYGGIRFVHVELYGSEKAFITDNLIRIFLQECTIHSFKYVFYGTEPNSCQSIFVQGCYITSVDCVQYALRQAWDCHYDGNQIELCEKLFDVYIAKGFSFTNNIAEGVAYGALQGKKMIEFRNGFKGMLISGNYFEANETTVDMDAVGNSGNTGVIMGNVFFENLSGSKCIVVPHAFTNGKLRIAYNDFNLAAGAYAIAISETGHDMWGIEIEGCAGDYYDPEYKLVDIANYNVNPTLTANKTLTSSSAVPIGLVRSKNVIHLRGQFTLGENVAFNDTIFTIADEYCRPRVQIPFLAYTVDANGDFDSAIPFTIANTGVVRIKKSTGLSSGTVVLFDTTYVIY